MRAEHHLPAASCTATGDRAHDRQCPDREPNQPPSLPGSMLSRWAALAGWVICLDPWSDSEWSPGERSLLGPWAVKGERPGDTGDRPEREESPSCRQACAPAGQPGAAISLRPLPSSRRCLQALPFPGIFSGIFLSLFSANDEIRAIIFF